ncbi:hypothetical protein MTO96_028175 [Rhipicephalus appendiculatus]
MPSVGPLGTPASTSDAGSQQVPAAAAAPSPQCGRAGSTATLDPEVFNEQAMALFRAALDCSPPDANVLCSPLGIASAMAAADAPSPKGEAATTAPRMGDPEGVAACVRRFHNCDAVCIGNLLHVDARTRLDDEYRTLFEGSLQGKVRTTAAASERGAAASKDIGDSTNRWASELTGGAVTSVFGWPEAAPNAQQERVKRTASTEKTTQLPESLATCLVNLVYLNGCWEEGFTGAGDLPFYAEPDRAQMVPMMTQRGSEMPYVRRPSFSCLRLRFACESSHMALFVPSLQSGCVEQELLPAIRRWSDMRATSPVRRQTRRQRAASPPRRRPTLRASPPGGRVRDFRVEGLYHKASLDLTTRGGKVAPPVSRPSCPVCSTIPPNEPVRFVVDRPFVFAVLVEDLLIMIGPRQERPE